MTGSGLALTHVATSLPSSLADGAATARVNRPRDDGATDRAVHRHEPTVERQPDVATQDLTPMLCAPDTARGGFLAVRQALP